MSWRIEQWDVQRTPWPLADESVQCVVTSPPYWGLRDYGTARWDGGSTECDHVAPPDRGMTHSTTSTLGPNKDGLGPENAAWKKVAKQYVGTCAKCGAKRIDSQIGQERTPEEYVEKIVAVFREVRRVLRKDGTVWLNLGDCYQGGNRGAARGDNARSNRLAQPGLKAKDLVGIPWRVAFALQADGWWLRSDVVWAKLNCMPESVTDRPTRAHEFIFLLTKNARYFYDAEAIKQPVASGSLIRLAQPTFDRQTGGDKDYGPDSNRSARRTLENLRKRRGSGNLRRDVPSDGDGRGIPNDHLGRGVPWEDNDQGVNARTVWVMSTQPFAEAHFATFPPELPKRCILAGTSAHGACVQCGAPRRRVLERLSGGRSKAVGKSDEKREQGLATAFSGYDDGAPAPAYETVGWAPTCGCATEETRPCMVLDPFSGAGTTALVADRLGRDAVGLELNPEYVEMARRRIGSDAPLFANSPDGVAADADGPDPAQTDLLDDAPAV